MISFSSSKLITLWIFIAYIDSTHEQCGALTSCDHLVSISLFQKGVCGRTARCFWELMHLEKYLLGDASKEREYEETIKKLLCHIPTYEVYRELYGSKATFIPCGKEVESMYNASEWLRLFRHFPIPDLYIVEVEDKLHYLNRMEECRVLEDECLEKLNKTIVEMCTNEITLNHLQAIEENHMLTRMRGKMTYQFIHGKNDPVQEDLANGNKCLMRHLSRIRHSAADQHEDITYSDKYIVRKSIQRVLYHKQVHQIRPPFYDLYVLYMSDPRGHFAQAPAEERWWNESKAYQKLAHYLPTNMIVHFHDALKCVYDKVNSNFMVWDPNKFCYTSSTFVCVQNTTLKNSDCGAIAAGVSVRQNDAEKTVIPTPAPPTG